MLTYYTVCITWRANRELLILHFCECVSVFVRECVYFHPLKSAVSAFLRLPSLLSLIDVISVVRWFHRCVPWFPNAVLLPLLSDRCFTPHTYSSVYSTLCLCSGVCHGQRTQRTTSFSDLTTNYNKYLALCKYKKYEKLLLHWTPMEKTYLIRASPQLMMTKIGFSPLYLILNPWLTKSITTYSVCHSQKQ